MEIRRRFFGDLICFGNVQAPATLLTVKMWKVLPCPIRCRTVPKTTKKERRFAHASPAKPMQNCMARLIGTLSQELTMEFEPCGRR